MKMILKSRGKDIWCLGNKRIYKSVFSHNFMANITLAIPDSLHKKLKKHSEIRWSEVIRRILQKNLEQLEILDEIVKKSRFTEKDVEEISDKIDNSVAKKLGLR